MATCATRSGGEGPATPPRERVAEALVFDDADADVARFDGGGVAHVRRDPLSAQGPYDLVGVAPGAGDEHEEGRYAWGLAQSRLQSFGPSTLPEGVEVDLRPW